MLATINQTAQWTVVERWDGSDGEWKPLTRPFDSEEAAEDLYFNICRIVAQAGYRDITGDSLGGCFSMRYRNSDTARDYDIAYYKV